MVYHALGADGPQRPLRRRFSFRLRLMRSPTAIMGRPITFGYTSNGRYLAVVWEHVDTIPGISSDVINPAPFTCRGQRYYRKAA